MITSFVAVFIIIIMTFLVTHPLFQTSHIGRNWRPKALTETPEFLLFLIDISSARAGDSSLLPLEVQSFLPTLCWWQDFKCCAVFGLHCAEGPVRSSSSVASEEPSTNQDIQDFLWLLWSFEIASTGRKEWMGGVRSSYDRRDHIFIEPFLWWAPQAIC